MPRYIAITNPRADEWFEDRPAQPLPHPVAYEGGPIDTGLKDAAGRPIYRVPDEIGFLHRGKA